MSDELRIFGKDHSFNLNEGSSSSVVKHPVIGRKLKKQWIVVGILLFFLVPGFLFLAVPAIIIYSIVKANNPSKSHALDFLFEKESKVAMYNKMMKEGTGSVEEKHYLVNSHGGVVESRGSGFESSGVLKKLFGVGLLFAGILIMGIFVVYVFVEYSSGFVSVPFLSEFGSFVSAGLLVVGLLFVWFFIKLVSPRSGRF